MLILRTTNPFPLDGGRGDGGENFTDRTPTFILPHPGGGEYFFVDQQPMTCDLTALEPVVVEFGMRAP